VLFQAVDEGGWELVINSVSFSYKNYPAIKMNYAYMHYFVTTVDD